MNGRAARSKGTWKQELRDQLSDIKEPTALQSAGQRYGEWVARREEAKRAVLAVGFGLRIIF
jgi:hypothetical protein